jgi:hypothetical protein
VTSQSAGEEEICTDNVEEKVISEVVSPIAIQIVTFSGKKSTMFEGASRALEVF